MVNNFFTPKETADLISESSINKATMSIKKRVFLSFMAGIFISLGGQGFLTIFNNSFLRAAVFPVGLMLIVLVGGELFTGNCMMTFGYTQKKIKLKNYISSILQVYFGNLIGALFVVFLVYFSGLYKNGSTLYASITAVATAKSNLTFVEAMFKGILCNILVVLGVWFATASKDITGKLLGCWFPVMLFVLCGYEHCVANMFFMPLGALINENITIFSVINNLIPVTIGNFIGGGLLIPLVYNQVFYK
ncbi:formate/nitrite transporter family protein [Sedimentibacter sp. zth1]|uniref:formate/nitrite transporter family protein n=1 Tax=Sedimentibacter sp. zth1 TaxID=2816908 RepID=UPI001A937D64|nr:formate/nitrite transporter family protein [Sedimentibacter sp. zth1]QSX07034.1 formate/nitrite transporter family protein [Sedimentibacter sp. zth1]